MIERSDVQEEIKYLAIMLSQKYGISVLAQEKVLCSKIEGNNKSKCLNLFLIKPGARGEYGYADASIDLQLLEVATISPKPLCEFMHRECIPYIKAMQREEHNGV